MRGRFGLRRLCGSLTGLLLLLGSALLGCSSSTQLEALQYQLTDIQRQIRQLQTDTARQDVLEEIREQLAAELASLRAAQGDHTDDLARLDERIAAIRADLATAGAGIESLREQLGAAQEGLVALEEAVVAAQAPRSGVEGGPTFADPQELYQSSYDHFLRGNYTDAISGFRQYLERFPNSELADNATYWIGESYFSQGEFEEAIQAFGLVASLYPNSERIASSLLREGSARIELGDQARGRRALLAVVERYPQSDEAILARQQLDRLPG